MAALIDSVTMCMYVCMCLCVGGSGCNCVGVWASVGVIVWVMWVGVCGWEWV